MNKQKLLDELAKLASCLEDFKGITGYCDGKYAAYEIAIELAKQLDEPQAEEVEVPPMIDKFIKDHTDPIFEICAWSDHYGNDGRTCDDPDLSVVLDWYGNNTTEFYEAVVNGYTVKSKRWVVKRADGDYVTSFNQSLLNTNIDVTSSLDCASYYKFTDRKKAEAVATLVEGSVEEID